VSYTYATFTTALAAELAENASDANFLTILPTIIQNAELRCYRDLDLLSTIVTDTATATINSRGFTLPQNQGRFVVVEQMNVLASGVHTPLTPISKEALTAFWPSDTSVLASDVPTHFAPVTDQLFLLAPPPGSAVTIEVVGTIRPAALSAINTTTFLTLYLPDLFFAAAMCEGAAWQKNYGAAADEPRQAQSWEQKYAAIFSGARGEEIRKKFGSASWSSKSPMAALPDRG